MKCYGKWPVCTELKRQVPKQCLVSFIFHPRSSPLGVSHIKMGDYSSEILKRTLRGTKILLCGRGLKSFSPLRDTNSKTIQYLLSYIFQLSTAKGTIKAPTYICCTLDLLWLNTLRTTKTTSLTHKTPPIFKQGHLTLPEV